MKKIIDCIDHKDFIFLTLTQKNCETDELSKEIDRINYAWKKLKQKTIFKRAFVGYVRALEVTYNQEHNTFHPHQHIILHTSKDYYENAYITHDKIQKMWSDLIEQSHSNVDIRKIKADTEKDLSKAIAEISKYTLKFTDITDEKVLKKLYIFMTGRRCFTSGGTFKVIAKKLNIEIGEDSEEITNKTIQLYRYSNGKYIPI